VRVEVFLVVLFFCFLFIFSIRDIFLFADMKRVMIKLMASLYEFVVDDSLVPLLTKKMYAAFILFALCFCLCFSFCSLCSFGYPQKCESNFNTRWVSIRRRVSKGHIKKIKWPSRPKLQEPHKDAPPRIRTHIQNYISLDLHLQLLVSNKRGDISLSSVLVATRLMSAAFTLSFQNITPHRRPLHLFSLKRSCVSVR
jgi:hypothetical protein